MATANPMWNEGNEETTLCTLSDKVSVSYLVLILKPTYTYLVALFRDAIATKLPSNKGTQMSIANVNEILT